jgi:transposase InsO family protein
MASSSLRIQELKLGDSTILCDVSTGQARPVVPIIHRRAVFTALHGIAHPGILASKRLIAARFVWPAMARDITSWCRDCQHCARSKVQAHSHTAVQPIPVPGRRFAHIHVDLVGPLPTMTEGYNHLLTVVDRTTRWAEAIPLRKTTTAACAEALFAGWIARFGVPSEVTSDRGPQFSSSVWAEVCGILGITHHKTTAYHPKANGMVERFHRQLKCSLRARLCGSNWLTHLPWVMLGLRATPKEDSAVSSAEMVYGLPLTLAGQFLEAREPPASVFLDRLRDTVWGNLPTQPPPAAASQEALPKGLMDAPYVYLRRDGAKPPLSQVYEGPFAVVKRTPKVFTIRKGRQEELVSVDRLKPHLGEAAVEAADPIRRGRPPVVAAMAAALTVGGWTLVSPHRRRYKAVSSSFSSRD